MNRLFGNEFVFDTRDRNKEAIIKGLTNIKFDTSISLNDKVKYIYKYDDFPAAVSGQITLEDNINYIILDDIDLLGNQIVCGTNNVIDGISSETCSITSTGLPNGVAMIMSDYTLNIRNITLRDVDTCFDLNGTYGSTVLDWMACNLLNIANIGEISNYTNFIMVNSAWLNSSGLVLSGEFDTIGFDTCLFTNFNNATTIEIMSGSTINRRFKMVESSMVTSGTGISIDFKLGSVVGNQGYILTSVNFSGGTSTHLAGYMPDSNQALFFKNLGIANSRSTGGQYLTSPSLTTLVLNTWKKLSGTTAITNYSQKFKQSVNNRLTYEGNLIQLFSVNISAGITGNNNDQLVVGISKNGNDPTDDTSISQTFDSGGSISHVSLNTFIQLEFADYVEIWVKNETGSNSVTAVDLKMTVSGPF